MEASTSTQALYCFGRFTVDPVKRLLSRDGTLVPLRPTVFETLLYLLDNPGRVVTKPNSSKRSGQTGLSKNRTSVRRCFCCAPRSTTSD